MVYLIYNKLLIYIFFKIEENLEKFDGGQKGKRGEERVVKKVGQGHWEHPPKKKKKKEKTRSEESNREKQAEGIKER
jgi:hypothetical protein